MAPPTLLFVVGATKSGTSWLHEALADHPQCHLRTIKELHYFDALDKGKLAQQAAEIQVWRDRLAKRLAEAPWTKRAGLAERVRDRDDWLAVLKRGCEDRRAYLDYLQAGQGEARVIGDVTPAYALLSVERLRKMATLTEDVRFVYVMRDPVARLWSHVRMMAVRRGDGQNANAAKARTILSRTLAGQEREIEIRGDYAGALTRLNDAVAQNRLLTLFYEDLFEGDGMMQIYRFLDLPPRPGAQSRLVHQGAPLDMPEPLRDKARDWLAPQYDFVARKLGRLPPAWQANQEEV